MTFEEWLGTGPDIDNEWGAARQGWDAATKAERARIVARLRQVGDENPRADLKAYAYFLAQVIGGEEK